MKKIVIIILLIIGTFSVEAAELMQTGQIKTYNSSQGYNILKLLLVSDETNKAVFQLNKEIAAIGEDERHIFKDGSNIYVRTLFKNDEPGKDMVEFFVIFRSWQSITENKIAEENVSAKQLPINTTKIENASNKILTVRENITNYSKSEESFIQKIIKFFKNLFRAQ